MQLDAWGFIVLKKRPNYVYDLHDKQSEHDLTAIALQESFDFYTYRLNRGEKRVDLLLVQRHNAVCPVAVLELTTGQMFTACAVPSVERDERKRRNSEEVNLLLSKIILGFNGVQEELDQMEPRTRRWYLQRSKEYLRARVGRPWAS